MNNLKTRWVAIALGLAFVTGLISASAGDKDKDSKYQKNGGKTPAPHTKATHDGPATAPPKSGDSSPTTPADKTPSSADAHKDPHDSSNDNGKSNGDVNDSGGKSGKAVTEPHHPPDEKPAKTTSTGETKNSGMVEPKPSSNAGRERTTVDKSTGATQTEHIAPTGRVVTKEVQKPDGSKQVTHYDLGREKTTEVVHADKSVETTEVHYNRSGGERARETVTRDASGKAVSKTVIVKQNIVIKNTTVVNVERNYRPGRWGFVYHPMVIRPVVFVSWYDPYWYTPAGVVIVHPFHYSWGWYGDPWYRRHAYYWEPYPVYAAPSYWVTDWMVADYMADRYAVTASVEQTQEEARLAREDAENARAAAQQAKDDAQIAEAKAAQAEAEARAERAEARVAKAQLAEAKSKELAGKPNPNATPIDKDTKDALKDQVEKSIAEKKAFADQTAKGENPVPADVSVALADPKHIYPVSKNLSVIRAEDSKPAGTLSGGDLLKLEPGQESALKSATENTPINMRVITSKGEDDSVPAGTVVAIPLKELQEFDNEFRAKIDQGLLEADNNKDSFKKGVDQK